MARTTAARLETVTATARRRPPAKHLVRTTLGELIAAAYDAVGPDASPEGVALLLKAPGLAGAVRPRYDIAD